MQNDYQGSGVPPRIALVGNPNVGKSSIFNQLTGLNQTVGNWPGKTVELAEGTLVFEGATIRIVDMPGTYSLSSYSEEELVTRDFLLSSAADVIINVVDATALERNLYLTLQLLEMGLPIILAVNFIDAAYHKGISFDFKSLQEGLGVTVIPVDASSGQGMTELMGAAMRQLRSRGGSRPPRPKYGKEMEYLIADVARELHAGNVPLPDGYPIEWISLKLIEGDPEVMRRVKLPPDLLARVSEKTSAVESIHGESANVITASERYSLSHRIVERSLKPKVEARNAISEWVSDLLTHRVYGYLVLAAVLGGTFYLIFQAGGILSGTIDSAFSSVIVYLAAALSFLPPMAVNLLLNGVVFGIGAATSIALPYIATFYIALSIFEDTGYLPRAAFLLDSLMHKIGLHGKAFIPMLLGFGCSVPACMGCRIMETRRECLLLGALVVLIPCSARTIVILGVAGAYLGIGYALLIYLIDMLLVLAIGRVLFKALPGESVGLIMEMPPLRMFKPVAVLKRTWLKTKDFVFTALPLIVLGSVAVEAASSLGAMDAIVNSFSPVTVGILGLPVATGVALIFGLLRKEMALIMLAAYAGTTNFALIMSPAQMFVFTLVMVIYLPCVATLAALIKEYGARRAALIVVMDILLALAVGAVASQMLSIIRF